MLQPIVEKTLGSKDKKLVYSKRGEATTRNVETPKAQQHAFVLQDAEIVQLARWACAIEKHYGTPMDIEWAKDGEADELYVVQAGPETVQPPHPSGTRTTSTLKGPDELLLTGLSVGAAIAAGSVCLLKSPEQIEQFTDGAILVTRLTDPDWVPIMKRAKGIITDNG